MKKIALLFILLLAWGPVRAEKAVPLDVLTNPDGIAVNNRYIYVSDFPHVYIFSLKDFGLERKIGKKGAGPGEFLPRTGKKRLFIHVLPDAIFVESRGRVSFFTLKGDFVKEFNVGATGYRFQPWQGKFLGKKRIPGKHSLYGTLNLFDANFTRLKEVYRVKYAIQPGRDIIVFNPNDFRYHPGKNFLYIRDKKEFAVKIYDRGFKLVSTIKRDDYVLRKILPGDQKKMHHVFKLSLKERYEPLKHRIKFPDTFVAIRNLIIDGGTLYMITYKKLEGGVECFTYTQDGKFVRALHIPLRSENILQYYPHTIHNGILYQLVENEETETWELCINRLTPGQNL